MKGWKEENMKFWHFYINHEEGMIAVPWERYKRSTT